MGCWSFLRQGSDHFSALRGYKVYKVSQIYRVTVKAVS